MTEELRIVDADTLLSTPIKKTRYIIEGFLPEGISILCGAPKVGKSWLMLWICLQVSQALLILYLSLQKIHELMKQLSLLPVAEILSSNNLLYVFKIKNGT